MIQKISVTLFVLAVIGYLAASIITIDPKEQRPGTRLAGSLAVEQNPDWSHLTGRTQIQVQTRTWYLIPHSVTTVSWTVDNDFFVPCGHCATKRWPRNVERDPRVRLKVEGKLYDRIAIRVTDVDELRKVFGVPPGKDLPDAWLYRMDVAE